MIDQDRKRTVVLIPGMQCTAQLWETVTALLPHEGPVVAVEVRSPTVDLAADEILSLTDDDLILVGHSLGGVVALAAARRAPERVLALALISVNPCAPTPTQHTAWNAMNSDALGGRLEAQIERTVAISTPPGAPADIAHVMANSTGVDGLLVQLATQHSREDERAGLARFAGPILMLGGRHDILVPPGLLRATADLHPRTTLVVHETAQHLLPLEAPQWVVDQFQAWSRTALKSDRPGVSDGSRL